MMSPRFEELGNSTFDEVRGLARQVNDHAKAIAELNTQIVYVEANGSLANDLRDRRNQHVQEIAKLLDTRAIERQSGSVDLLVGGHLLVGRSRICAVCRQGGGGPHQAHDRHLRGPGHDPRRSHRGADATGTRGSAGPLAIGSTRSRAIRSSSSTACIAPACHALARSRR
ncbi:MAG: hypothetical protein V9E82_04615 [Candidatus Nanopelagicales bacterium]